MIPSRSAPPKSYVPLLRRAAGVAVLVPCVVGAAACLAAIRRRDDARSVTVPFLVPGRTAYLFYYHPPAPSPARCVGGYAARFSVSEAAGSYSGEGVVSVSSAAFGAVTPRLSVWAETNGLAQVGGSIFKLTLGDTVYSAGTTGVDPVRVRLRTEGGAGTARRDLELPGPIVLRPSAAAGGAYGLRFPGGHLAGMLRGPGAALGAGLPDVRSLAVPPPPDRSAPSCPAAESGALPVDGILARVAALGARGTSTSLKPPP